MRLLFDSHKDFLAELEFDHQVGRIDREIVRLDRSTSVTGTACYMQRGYEKDCVVTLEIRASDSLAAKEIAKDIIETCNRLGLEVKAGVLIA